MTPDSDLQGVSYETLFYCKTKLLVGGNVGNVRPVGAKLRLDSDLTDAHSARAASCLLTLDG